MADEEAEQDSGGGGRAAWPRPGLRERLRRLEEGLRRSAEPPARAAGEYCQRFCQTLLEYAEKWKTSEDHLPLLEVYTDAIQSYSKARPYLTTECENVAVVLERLALSCVELLLCLPHDLPDKHWKEFQTAVQGAHQSLLENGSFELHFLYTLSQEKGVWKNPVLHSILHEEPVEQDKVNEFMALEDPILLEMRIKHLLKASQITQATILAKLCSDHQDLRAKGNFKQIYLVCLCSQSPNIKLIEEIFQVVPMLLTKGWPRHPTAFSPRGVTTPLQQSRQVVCDTIAQIDCKDALEMICNLESEGDEKTALIICAAFLSRQLQHGEMDCAWELTLFWSKLQQRVDPSVQVYLERCRQLSLLTKTVYHIFFLIKIIQSETEGAGLSTCIELCVRALRLESSENSNVKISICKTISCLLPDDLEVKRACQLSEFLLEPTVDAYYAVEMLYNQPDQKYDEESLPVPNSLRCELLLVLKTRWPFDPEFWDWKTLKRQCLALMGEEASIVSSIDELNDSEVYEKLEDSFEDRKEISMNGMTNSYDISSGVLGDLQDDRRKKKEVKKLREKGFVSARFRNFQAYMQYCVLCDKEFLGHRIIKHAQRHLSDGTYSCPICAKKFDSKERLVPHVTLHVKQSSKERLDAMKPLRRLGRPPKLAISREKQKAVSKQEHRSIKKNSLYSDDFIVFNDNDGTDEENYVKDNSFEPEDIPFQKQSHAPEFTCPVMVCKKGFKYYKNLLAHVRAHKGNEEAELFLEMQSKKVICHYCRRHFVSIAHLNDHLQTHCGSKPYMCIQMKCKASFNSNAQLLAHRKEHSAFRAKCMFPKCGRIFSESSTLYEHEAQHYHTFTCKFTGCGKVYHSQNQLEKHLHCHQFQQEDGVKDQSNTTVKYNQPSREKKGDKNVTVKTEPPFDLNSISNTNFTTGSLNNIQRIKEEPIDIQQALSTDAAEHTVLGVCGQVLPPSKEFGQMLLPTAGLSKLSAPQTTVSGQVMPATVMLGHSSVNMLEKAEATVTSSHIKKTPLSKGICDIILTQGKLAAAVNMIDTGNTLLSQIYTAVKDACNDSSLPIFQESKEVECFNQSPQDLKVSLHSGTCKMDLATQTVERQMGTVMHCGLDNEVLYETSFVFPEFEDRVKAAANMLTLPSKSANGNLFVSSQSSITNPLASSVLKQPPVQKFTCKIEGCTKIYNSIQSIGKHMKATHPQQYPAFTLERKRKKRQRSRNSSNAAHGAKVIFGMTPQVGCNINSALPQHKNMNTNPSYPSEIQSVQTPVFSTHLENLVNPMLPSVDNMNPGGTSHSKNSSEAFLSSQFEELSKAGLPLKFEKDSDPFLPLPAEDGPISNFPTLTLNGTNQVFSQLGNNELLSQTEATTNSVFPKEEYGADTDSEFSLSETSPPSSAIKKDGHEQSSNGKEKRHRHTSRVKCPAIIRDGKFICRRCFRAFDNPRSLGGHLSKRSICKPIDDETEISQELLQSSGQASLLASMILSSNLQSPQQATFSPETCFKDPAFLQSLAGESQSSPFLHNLLTQASAANFPATVHDERNEILKQALETAGIAGTLESTAMLPQMTPANCVLGTSTINTMVLPCSGVSPVLEPACSPGMFMDRSKTLSSNIEESNCPIFSADLLSTFDTGICSHPVVATQCVPSNSSRVSVISGPLGTIPSQVNKKKSGGSKKKKKTVAPFIEGNLSQNLLASDLLTAMGNLAKTVKENVQIPTDNLQHNFISNCDSRLVGSMTNALNTNNPVCIGSIHDNFKRSSEAPTLVLPVIKTENEDSSFLSSFSCEVNTHSGFQIPKANSQTDIMLDILKTNMNSSHFTAENVDVRDNTRSVITSSGPNACKVNSTTDHLPGNNFPNVLPADNTQLPVCAADFSLHTSTPVSEIAQTDDKNIMEILELLHSLKLENDLTANGFESDTTSASPPSDFCSPLSPTLVAAGMSTPRVFQETDVCDQLIDKNAKPFVCREHTCNYRAMTKDALIKHYTRVHRYTPDLLMDVKKNQLKFSPFRCVIPSCPKTFTRNSNLRAHCQSVHHFSDDEMLKLRIKRPCEKPSLNEFMITPPHRIKSKKKRIKIAVERNSESSVLIEAAVKKEGDLKQREQINNEQEYKLQLAIRKQNLPKLASLLQEKRKKATLRKKAKELKEINMRRQRKERQERKQKRLEKASVLPPKYSPYRPYRCVHQNCFAAFTIQQNLILHYQAVHKPDLPTFGLQLEDFETYKDCDETERQQIKEFRCREYDCSRIFKEVASLIQHYMKLHEMIPEEIEQVMSVINIGDFKCDQAQCSSSFTKCSNYITHLEVAHEMKLRQCREDGIYKCDCEGCDRIYATRSNLSRHIHNKHNERNNEPPSRSRRFLPNDEENNSNKANEDKPMKHKPQEQKYDSEKGQITVFKDKKKKGLQSEINISKMKRKKSLLTLKCGKRFLFLKSRIDALSECSSDKLSKQYPCMIKGCTSIVASDHNVIRHYKCHKMDRSFTVKHRNILVVCKTRSVPHVSSLSSDDEGVCDETSEIRESAASSSVSSDESVASASQLSETEKDEVDELAELLDSKLVNEDNGASDDQAKTSSSINSDFKESSSSQSENQTSNNILKRAHKEKHVTQNKKRKVEDPEEELSVELSSVHSSEDTNASESIEDQAIEEPPPVFDWSSFKPMGFEVSFLKFLEESAVKQKKHANRDYHSTGPKKDLNLKRSSEKTSMVDNHACPSTEYENFIKFANPSQLQFIGIVQFVLDETLKDVTKLALKQLQEMKPTVILKKVDLHCDDTVASEPSCGNIGSNCSVEN